ATSGTMDPQGVWVTDSQVIGQSNISIDLNATDANNAEWHIERDTLNATNVCVNFNGIGEILATSNVCVISSNSGAGFQVATGNTQWTAGHI
ncbi:hypothetical protein ACKI1L_37535, partial [Streptomyces scabiei]|uniref:hypothetical protein n=1 Tax=Streptomyces scabiei TaxID=1930 RepID=UPI0038F6772A